MTSTQAARYLRILGVSVHRTDLETLRSLVSAQLCAVPFENISKLHLRDTENLRALPDLDTYLGGIERYGFGGTCYANNYYFSLLLGKLGYDSRICGADMSQPDVHLVCMVMLDGRDYLIDVGYGAPFTAPIPRDARDDIVIRWGHEQYVFKPPDTNGISRMDHYRDGRLHHGYRAHPEARRIGEFTSMIAETYRPDATFINNLFIARFCAHEGVIIGNFHRSAVQDRHTEAHDLPSRDDVIRAITTDFGMPEEIVRPVAIDLLPPYHQ